MVDRTGSAANQTTGLLIRTFLKVLATMVAVFVLVRLAAPILMDIHNDLAFWAGVACWPAAAVVGILAAGWIVRDAKTIRRLQGAPPRLSGPD